MKKHVALIGMMGAGKTTVGALLAKELGRLFFDSDVEVRALSGLTPAEYFEAKGEPAFREAEAAAIREAVTKHEPVVIGVGGGAVEREDTQNALKSNCLVVLLQARVATLLSRVGDGGGRPMLSGNPGDKLRELLNAREHTYKELADAVVDVDAHTPDELAKAIAVMVRDLEEHV